MLKSPDPIFLIVVVLIEIVRKTFHCRTCDKAFIDKETASEHNRSTGHKITEMLLE
jgi:hypothetical protein